MPPQPGTRPTGIRPWPATGGAGRARSISSCAAADLFVFCEVKARTTDAFGVPAESVTRTKQARIRRLAARYLREAAPVRDREVRFDVVSVLAGELEVLEGAF